jgi:hypothetical protein
MRRALAIAEKAQGPDHVDLLAGWVTWRRAERGVANAPGAQTLYERALVIQEFALGRDHVELAIMLRGLAEVLSMQGRLVPITVAARVDALLEIWHDPQRDSQAVPGVMQFLVRLADVAGVYLYRQQEPAPRGDELWGQLDAFAQRIHGGLRPTEMAYLVANEGRQLIGPTGSAS